MKKSIQFAVAVLALALAGSAADFTPAALVYSGRADDAIRTLKGQTSAGQNAEAYHLLCRVYYSLEDWDNAVRSGEQAVKLNGGNSDYHLWLGRSYGEKADKASALSAFGLARKTVASFEKAVQLNPANVAARKDLAEYYVSAPAIVGGGKDKARKLADDIAGSDPVTAAEIRGLIATRDKNFADAEKQYRAAVDASQGAAGPLIELARLYRNQQRWAEFDATMSRALTSRKRQPNDLYDAGELLVGVNRNVDGALDALKQYLAGSTSDYGPAFRAHYLLGQALERKGDRNGAVAEYKTALSLASGYRPAQDALRKIGG